MLTVAAIMTGVFIAAAMLTPNKIKND